MLSAGYCYPLRKCCVCCILFYSLGGSVYIHWNHSPNCIYTTWDISTLYISSFIHIVPDKKASAHNWQIKHTKTCPYCQTNLFLKILFTLKPPLIFFDGLNCIHVLRIPAESHLILWYLHNSVSEIPESMDIFGAEQQFSAESDECIVSHEYLCQFFNVTPAILKFIFLVVAHPPPWCYWGFGWRQ